ncbi:MAG: nucleotidyltransferase domain-containing protein [Elusimicrobiota bacterium]
MAAKNHFGLAFRCALALLIAASPLCVHLSHAAAIGRVAPLQSAPPVGARSAAAGAAVSGARPSSLRLPLSGAVALTSVLPGVSSLAPSARALPEGGRHGSPAGVDAAPAADAFPEGVRHGSPAGVDAAPAADAFPEGVRHGSPAGVDAASSAVEARAAPHRSGLERTDIAAARRMSFGRLKELAASKASGPLWENTKKLPGLEASGAAAATPSPTPAGTAALRAGGRAPALKARAVLAGIRDQLFLDLRRYDRRQDTESFDWRPVSEPRHRDQVRIPERGWKLQARDAYLYLRIYLRSLLWRSTTRLYYRWEQVKTGARERRGAKRAVRRLLPFLLANLVMGSTGRVETFGLRTAHNRIVVADAWSVFNRYFRTDQAATGAFSRLILRARHYNPNRRLTQFRKILVTALREASVRSPAELPAYFDSLVTTEAGQELIEFQKDGQRRTLEVFDRAVRESILAVNKGLPAGRRVVGAVLMGSFANGGAGPNSDLDIEIVTENGSTVHLKAFYDGLKARWKAAGMSRHPIGDFEYALPVSKSLISRMHQEPYIVFSPYPEVIEALQRSPAEERARKVRRVRKWTGRLSHALLISVWLLSLAVYEACKLFSRKFGPSRKIGEVSPRFDSHGPFLST